MRLILSLLMLSSALFGQADYVNLLPPCSGSCETVAERTKTRADGIFIVRYEYDRSAAEIPLTNPPGQPHYSATITVSRVISEELRRIGNPFPGVYTPAGCFEDDPDTLIAYALKHQDDLPPTPKASLAAASAIIPFPPNGTEAASVLSSAPYGEGSPLGISMRSAGCVPTQEAAKRAISDLRKKADRWSSGDEVSAGSAAEVMRQIADTLEKLFSCK